MPFEKSAAAMRAYRDANLKYALVSVPYRSWQIFGELFANGHMFHHKFWWRKFTSLESFKEHEDPLGHKWEVGYKGYPLKKVEKAFIADAGWRLVKRDFSYPACVVFWLLEAV